MQIASGLPNFLVVGLPDKAVGEARERVRAAITAMGLALPPKRVLVNLAPADMHKEGSHFDLPIAVQQNLLISVTTFVYIVESSRSTGSMPPGKK
jgi:predicted ATPase with chaperone activity